MITNNQVQLKEKYCLDKLRTLPSLPKFLTLSPRFQKPKLTSSVNKSLKKPKKKLNFSKNCITYPTSLRLFKKRNHPIPKTIFAQSCKESNFVKISNLPVCRKSPKRNNIYFKKKCTKVNF